MRLTSAWMFPAALVAIVVASARAQEPGPPPDATVGPGRASLVFYGTYHWLDTGEDLPRDGVGGYGVRAIFNNDPAEGWIGGLGARSSLSLFASFTPVQSDVRYRTMHYGIQSDFSLLRVPAGDVFDPSLSLALGAFRLEDRTTPGVRRSVTRFALTPGIGADVRIVRPISVRLAVRDVMLFKRDELRNLRIAHNLELSGGLGYNFF